MKKQEGKKAFVRNLKRTMFAQLAFMCYVYGTSHTESQLLVAHVVCVLTAVMAVLLAMLGAVHTEQRAQQEWLASQRASVHYPAGAAFQAKVDRAEQSYRTRGRVNEFV
jgi:hypothetical protein